MIHNEIKEQLKEFMSKLCKEHKEILDSKISSHKELPRKDLDEIKQITIKNLSKDGIKSIFYLTGFEDGCAATFMGRRRDVLQAVLSVFVENYPSSELLIIAKTIQEIAAAKIENGEDKKED